MSLNPAVERPLDRAIGWLGMATGLGGSLALAVDLDYAQIAFAVWFLSNFAWVVHSWRVNIWSQGVMQLGYAAVNAVGVYRYFGLSAGLGAGLLTMWFFWVVARGLRKGGACASESAASRVFGWIGCGSGLLGSLIIALALGGERWGFPVWILSNTAWLIHAWRTRIWSQAAMQVGYFGINMLALGNYFAPIWAAALAAYLMALIAYLHGSSRRPQPVYAD